MSGIQVPAGTFEGEPTALGGAGVVSAYLEAALAAPARDGDERALREGLEQLVELAELRPRMFRDHASGVLGAALGLFGGPARALAVELVCGLCEAAPATCRRCRVGGRPLPEVAVDALAGLLLEADDGVDPAAWEADPAKPPDLPQDCGRELGADAIDRLAGALRPAAVLPRAFGVMATLLRESAESPPSQWRRAHAAMAAAAQLAEHLGDLESAAPAARALVPLLATGRAGKASAKKRRRDLVETILPFAVGYPAAVVRADAWGALGLSRRLFPDLPSENVLRAGQACLDMAPRLQMELGGVVLPAVGAAADADKAPRARAAACWCLGLFLDGCGFSTLEPHLTPTAATLSKALTPETPAHVREYAVAAAAGLAQSAATCADDVNRQATCGALYRGFAQALKPLAAGAHYEGLAAADRGAAAALRARALECLALCGCEAGRDVFGDDARELLVVIMRDYFDEGSRRPEDDAERAGALKSVVKVAACLGSDFGPFLAAVVPPLLEAARGDRVVVQQEYGIDEDSDSEAGGEDYVVRTEALEEQETACQLVILLADATGAELAPYAAQCLEGMASVLQSAICGDVRARAAAALAAIVGCAARRRGLWRSGRRSGRRVAAADRRSGASNVSAPLETALRALLGAVAEEDEATALNTILGAAGDAVEKACRLTEGPDRPTADGCRPLLVNARVDCATVLGAALACVQATIQRRAVRVAEAKMDADFDDEARVFLGALAREDGNVFFSCGEIVGGVLRTHGAAAWPALGSSGWLARLAELADRRCCEDDRRTAAYVLCDILEFGGVAPVGFGDASAVRAEVAALLPGFAALASDPGPAARRQAAAYGLGAAAAKLGADFTPYAADAAAVLGRMMAERPPLEALEAVADEDDEGDAEAHEAEMVADNAAAALSRVLRAAPLAGAWDAWLAYVPLRGDAVEADACLEVLASLCGGGALGLDLRATLAAVARCGIALNSGAGGTTARSARGVNKDGRETLLKLRGGLLALQAQRQQDLGRAWAALDAEAQSVLQAVATASVA